MCITIKLTLKQALVLFTLCALAVCAYVSDKRIKENVALLNTVEIITCELVDTTSIMDGKWWHNNWQYTYNNATYSYTDKTQNQPESQECCIDINNIYGIVPCPKNEIFEIVALTVMVWFFGWCLLGILWAFHSKKKKPQVIQLADTTANV